MFDSDSLAQSGRVVRPQRLAQRSIAGGDPSLERRARRDQSLDIHNVVLESRPVQIRHAHGYAMHRSRLKQGPGFPGRRSRAGTVQKARRRVSPRGGRERSHGKQAPA